MNNNEQPGHNEGNVEATLASRQSSHGDFSENSRVSQALKNVIRDYRTVNFSMAQQEALDMICHKISRIACGDPDFADHWHDIAGYASLIEGMLD